MSQMSAATFKVLRARADKEQRQLRSASRQLAAVNKRVEGFLDDKPETWGPYELNENGWYVLKPEDAGNDPQTPRAKVGVPFAEGEI